MQIPLARSLDPTKNKRFTGSAVFFWFHCKTNTSIMCFIDLFFTFCWFQFVWWYKRVLFLKTVDFRGVWGQRDGFRSHGYIPTNLGSSHPQESRPLPTSRFLAGSMVLIPSPGHRLLGEIPSFLGHTKGSLGIIQAELIITYETDWSDWFKIFRGPSDMTSQHISDCPMVVFVAGSARRTPLSCSTSLSQLEVDISYE